MSKRNLLSDSLASLAGSRGIAEPAEQAGHDVGEEEARGEDFTPMDEIIVKMLACLSIVHVACLGRAVRRLSGVAAAFNNFVVMASACSGTDLCIPTVHRTERSFVVIRQILLSMKSGTYRS